MVFNMPSPVQEGAQPYYQCLAASKVIQAEKAGAAELKAEKGRLEPTIRGVSQEIISGARMSTSRKSSGNP